MPTGRELGFLSEHFAGEELDAAIKAVDGGEPLAYVIGEWYFYGLTFRLNRDCLVPRPDTEHLVDRAVGLIPRGGGFIDLGCGSGCIALSVLHERPDARAVLCDISPGALDAARLNAAELGVADRAEFILADMRTDFLPGGRLFDVVVSNPPYIRSGVIPTLSEEVRREPRLALDGGADGLDFYRAVLDIQLSHLRPDGHIIFEIGFDQANDLRRLASERSLACDILRDYGGNDRVAVLSRRGAGPANVYTDSSIH